MELNVEGFYKKPRVLSGFKFLAHITETRKCGNRMPVYFPHKGTIDVIDYWIDMFGSPLEPLHVQFQTEWGKNDVWVEDIEEWEFVQYRPNTQWTAIKIEKKEDDMGVLFADRYKAEDYFKLLMNSIYGKNYFCVMVEGASGHIFEATGVEVDDNTALVTVAPNDERIENVLFTNIDTLEFEFTPSAGGQRGYYRAIRKEAAMESEKKLAPIDFQDFYIKETFDNLHEVVVLYDEQFYTVLGMRTNLAKPGNYTLYLIRQLFATVRKVEIGPNQKFIYQKNSNSWLVDPVETLYTDFTDVKDQLRAEGVKKVIVAGVEKELKRVSEISSGLLHLVFAYDGELEHFYSTKNTRLRVRDGKLGTEYLLDHVKRMHV